MSKYSYQKRKLQKDILIHETVEVSNEVKLGLKNLLKDQDLSLLLQESVSLVKSPKIPFLLKKVLIEYGYFPILKFPLSLISLTPSEFLSMLESYGKGIHPFIDKVKLLENIEDNIHEKEKVCFGLRLNWFRQDYDCKLFRESSSLLSFSSL